MARILKLLKSFRTFQKTRKDLARPDTENTALSEPESIYLGRLSEAMSFKFMEQHQQTTKHFRLRIRPTKTNHFPTRMTCIIMILHSQDLEDVGVFQHQPDSSTQSIRNDQSTASPGSSSCNCAQSGGNQEEFGLSQRPWISQSG